MYGRAPQGKGEIALPTPLFPPAKSQGGREKREGALRRGKGAPV